MYLGGKTDPKISKLYMIARACEVSLDWLTGDDSKHGSAENHISADFSLIPRLNVKASAGDGALNSSERTVEMLAFRRDWLRQMGINARTAHVLTARGDSMDPTIRDGDILLVDAGIDHVVDEGIYVVVLFGQLFVKRLERQGSGAIILRSDNPSIRDRVVEPDELPEMSVAGRVIWFGRSI